MVRRVEPSAEALARVKVLSGKQGGVLRRAQALDCDISGAQLDTLVRRGDWTKLHGGCVAPVASPPDAGLATLQIAAASCVRALEPGRFVGSGTAAARAHVLPLIHPAGQVRLIDRTPPRHRSRASHSALDDVDVTRVRGVLVTSVARTVVDLAREQGLLAGVAAADRALRYGVTEEQLAGAAQRVALLSNGSVATRAVQLARPTAESPLESIGRTQLVLHGLPMPEGQVDVKDRRGLIGRVDHVWRDLRVIGEADGRVKYEQDDDDARPKPERGVLWAEKAREDRLRVSFEVFRYSWAEAMHAPDVLVDKALTAFASAARRWSLPPWRPIS